MSTEGQREKVDEAIKKCENYAEEYIGEEKETFTQTTLWTDGDFKVMVWHGKGHEENPWRQDAEKVTYNHFAGEFVYADITRLIHRHTIKNNESIVIAETQVE